MTDKSKRDPFAVSLMHRFTEIRSILTTESHTKMAPVKAKVKGSARMYTQLHKHELVIKEHGLLKWNEKIPITYRLSVTMANVLRDISRVEVAAAAPKEKPGFKLETTEMLEKVVKHNHTRKRIPKPEPEKDVENKPSLTVSFAWGLFKYKRG